ncbi:MAG: type I DNA topoisomerase [Treponema porcinum]|uniref:type I DNA topoisomerase n=1 Tax=Treponema porcinum TaxID=261392 RepID=UPI002355F485|nr:type I DNA topoisomerase [Treponema porcinum]MCI6180485.1 type I DNA topoisomerase [Treponema porcinum]MCI6322506.1 type I DNA topoisomerase [Treponema porcinum]MCI6722670.1 type I DNA topoisomerase [Treponema porcinum]MCI6814973.1 type I DNA topoisomerase [Treponema porcinum]MCI6983939.1 type I DNA topoisomerase [Treponema porcinum]
MAEKKTASKKSKTPQSLVIVESPAKAHTIEKYLGPGYTVKASMGHLIDLPKSRMAIDVENDFQPEYITVRGRAKLLKELQKDAKKSDVVLLASDNDREGEAIAWHLNNALKDKTDAKISRIVFNEITPVAIKEAVQHPGEIVESKVNAQKARRVLDRLVGYNLSPLLWSKVKNGLSAGRVQSVALRLICEREEEVENFLPEEYWTLDADFAKGKTKFTAQLVKYKGEAPELKSEQMVNDIIKEIQSADCIVSNIRQTEKTVRPKAPFTTSKLQQASANRLGYTSRKTMQIAQQLYEGVNIGSNRVGLITYMRTDSVRISETALADVRKWIEKNHPENLPAEPIHYTVGKAAQDAHEGIRPTYTEYTPDSVKEYLTRDQLRLYTIIWERFVSSQMNNAKTMTTSAEITAGDAVFRVSASKITEKGFYSVIKLLSSKEDKTGNLPSLKTGEKITSDKFYPEQHFTQGPARYTDASIVRTLEEKGIGRPSTYAPIISVLLDRYYVTRSNKQLVPTQLGRMICRILVESFPEVINEHFTAEVENNLDKVEQDELVWNTMIADFFTPFKKRVDEVMESVASVKGSLDEPTDKICEKCGKPMMKKLGRFGFFLACSGFPECHNTKSIPLAKCPMPGCDGEIVARKTKGRGKEFYGCTNYPSCNFISHFKPIDQYCPKCGWFLVEKFDKKNGSYKSCINPDCDYLHSADDEEKIIPEAGNDED